VCVCAMNKTGRKLGLLTLAAPWSRVRQPGTVNKTDKHSNFCYKNFPASVCERVF